MAAIATFTMSTSVYAAENYLANSEEHINQDDFDEFVLISTDEYVDEDTGFRIVDKTFVKEEPTLYSTIEHKDVKKSRSIYSNDSSTYGDLLVMMWVSGTFNYDGDEYITVTNPKGWYERYAETTPYPKVTANPLKYASQQGSNFLFGNMYAYVEYTITLENYAHFTKDYRLWVDVNRKGEVSVDT